MRAITGSFLPLFLFPAVALFAGCATTFDAALHTANETYSLSGVHGSVYGGQQPIIGSHVYLYAAGTSGFGGASVGLLNAYATGSFPTSRDSNGNYYVTTDAGGNFQLTGEYSCTAGQQLYLYATGGDPGAGPNGSIGLMAVLGQCPTTGVSPFPADLSVSLNEVTTVAAAYSLAGFATDATHIADDEAVPGNTTQAQAKAGMANAFANAANITSLSGGFALSTIPAGTATVPTTLVNTLADIIASCVNSTAGSGTCNTLLTATSASDTATAMIYIAHHPGDAGVLAFYNSNVLPASPFVPTLSSVPHDFTLGLVYASNISASTSLAVDSQGNVWVPNQGNAGYSLGPNLQVIARSSASTPNAYLAGPSGYDPSGVFKAPQGIAIDLNDNAWVGDTQALYKVTGPPGSFSITSYTGNGLQYPGWVTTDLSGDVWVASTNSGGTAGAVSKFYPDGTAAPGSPFNYGFKNPGYLAMDSLGNVFVSDTKLTALSAATGALEAQDSRSVAGLAVDGNNSLWAAAGSSLLEYPRITASSFSGGAFPTPASFSGGGLTSPLSVSLDGAGDVWAANANTITELTNTGVALSRNGYNNFNCCASGPHGPILHGSPLGLVVDGSGDVWITNGDNTLVEVIGAAVPVVTPLAAGLTLGKLGTRP